MNKYMVYPGSESRPSLLTMLQDISLTLLDYHMSVGYVEPLQPKQIPVGGLTLRNDDGQLPKVTLTGHCLFFLRLIYFKILTF